MPTFKYHKLVRDKIAQFHLDAGHTPSVVHLQNEELVEALCKKLHEEADEVNGALNQKELTEEIADVQQIINDLCVVARIAQKDVEDVRLKKEQRKGGFQKGVYIDTVHIPNEDDEWAQYCRKSPEKYPEVKSK